MSVAYGPEFFSDPTVAASETTLVEIRTNLTRYRGFCFFLSTDQDGTARVYDLDSQGTARLLDSQSYSGAAEVGPGIINLLDNDYRGGHMRLTFQPVAPAVVYARGEVY